MDPATVILRSVPLVTRLVAAIGRVVLVHSELQAVEGCLGRAIEINDRTDIPGRYWNVRHPRQAFLWRRYRRAATRDLVMGVDLLADSTAHRDEAHVALADSSAQAETPLPDSMEGLRLLVRARLEGALTPRPLVPWTQRLAAALAIHAEQRCNRLAKQRGVDHEDYRTWACVVLNRRTFADDLRGQLDRHAFNAYGQRVGVRLVAEMAGHDDLEQLVRRLDREDRVRGDALLLDAMQGIRAALWLIALGVLAAAGDAAVHFLG